MFWAMYCGVAALWAAGNLWLYHQRTQPGRELGLSGSLSVWLWDSCVIVGMVLGAIYRPFGMWLTDGWQMAGLVVALVVALVGAALALWGMLEFHSLARVSALEENRLVTSGIYAHVRHPQHSGLIAAAFGLAVAFQTVFGLGLAAVGLLWSLAQTRLEDRRLLVLFGEEAGRYVAAVPRYVPRWAGYRHRAG